MKNETMPPSDRTAEQTKNRTKDRIIAAYEAYLRQEPMSLDNLLRAVTKFAYTKVYHLEYDFKDFGSYETADDWAQDVAVKVWIALKNGKFEGNGENFYSWIHKIAFNRATDAFNELEDEQRHKVSLTVESHRSSDPDGEEYEDDNPEIYSSEPDDTQWVGDGVDENGDVKYKQVRRSSGIAQIPESVKGKDYLICIMIIDGLKQAEIAEKMGMSLSAVKRRLQALRKRLPAEREGERALRRAEYAERHRPFKIVRSSLKEAVVGWPGTTKHEG